MTGHVGVYITRMDRVYDNIFTRILIKFSLLNSSQGGNTDFRNDIRAIWPTKFSMVTIFSSPVVELFIFNKHVSRFRQLRRNGDVICNFYLTNEFINSVSLVSVRSEEENVSRNFLEGICDKCPQRLDKLTTLAWGRSNGKSSLHTFRRPK